MSDNTKVNIIDKIKSNKKLRWFLIVILSIFLITVVIFSGFSGSKSSVLEMEDSYVLSLEKRLENVLCQVEGAGKVAVVINVESGYETVLAMKTTVTESVSATLTETSPILVNGKTVVIKELNPKITGVLIVCEGAKNISVLNKIQQATVSLLDINANKIEILTMK